MTEHERLRAKNDELTAQLAERDKVIEAAREVIETWGNNKNIRIESYKSDGLIFLARIEKLARVLATIGKGASTPDKEPDA